VDVWKPCYSCGLPRPRYRNRATRSGYDSHCKECAKAKVKAYREAHPDKVKEWQRIARYRLHGLTDENYEALGEVCHICGTTADGRRLCVDHDHRCCPGAYGCEKCVRGLLCDRCNFLVGAIEDEDLLAKAQAYLGR
jgi:hypothetical protein